MIRLFYLSVFALTCSLACISTAMSADGNPTFRTSGIPQSRGSAHERTNLSQQTHPVYRQDVPGQAGMRSNQFGQRTAPATSPVTNRDALAGQKRGGSSNPITPVVRQKQSGQSNLKNSAARTAPSIWGTLGALLVVISIILVSAKLFKKHSPLASANLPREVMEVLGKKPLDARQTIHFVRCGSRILILGSSPAGLEMLSEVLDPVEVDLITGMCRERAQAGRSNSAFLNLFQSTQNKSEQNDHRQSADRFQQAAKTEPELSLRGTEQQDLAEYESAVTRLQHKFQHSSRQSLNTDAESGHV